LPRRSRESPGPACANVPRAATGNHTARLARLAALSAFPHIELTTDTDAYAMLATFVDVATPILRESGYSFETQGQDWAHWTRGFHNVIRAYAFRDASRQGVSVMSQGEHPDGMLRTLAEQVAEAAGWKIAKHS
jgi:hypothetical protein